MKWATIAMFAGFLSLATPALADRNSYVPGAPAKPDAAPAAPDADAIAAGDAAISSGQSQRAVDLMAPLLAGYEKQYASEQRRIYCAISAPQTAASLSEAAKDGVAAISIEAGWCRALYIDAFALVDLQRLPEAEAAFRKLTAMAPHNARYLNELGFSLLAQKKWQDSLAVYLRAEAAADLTPSGGVVRERCVALRGEGYVLVELGKLDDAEAAYRKCLAIDPSDSKSQGEIQYIQQQRKKLI